MKTNPAIAQAMLDNEVAQKELQAALASLNAAALSGDKGKIEVARLDCHEAVERMLQAAIKAADGLRRELGLQ